MKFENNIDPLLNGNVPWLSHFGKDSDVVFSSRIRLARNIQGYTFPIRSPSQERIKILHQIGEVISGLPKLKDPISADLGELSKINRQVLSERSLISRDQQFPREGTGVFVSRNEQTCILVNEEDHLRLQMLRPGLQLSAIWNELDKLDDNLSEYLPYCYRKELGYLTSCPTNMGTGIRASVMLHLPALVFSRKMTGIINALNQMRFAVRGLFGEGSQPMGNFFQISNQSTLGEKEPMVIEKLERTIKRVIEHEKNARYLLLEQRRNETIDFIGRSFGILSYAYNLTCKDAFAKLSATRLGCDLGLISSVDSIAINDLIIKIQSGHLQKFRNKRINQKQRKSLRAEIVRNELQKRRSPQLCRPDTQV